MPKTALYHQDGRPAVELDILAENEDGTLELGRGETLVVGKCQVAAEPKPGFATVVATEPDKAPDDSDLAGKKVDELRALAVELGIDVTGLKKDALIAAITAAQTPQ